MSNLIQTLSYLISLLISTSAIVKLVVKKAKDLKKDSKSEKPKNLAVIVGLSLVFAILVYSGVHSYFFTVVPKIQHCSMDSAKILLGNDLDYELVNLEEYEFFTEDNYVVSLFEPDTWKKNVRKGSVIPLSIDWLREVGYYNTQVSQGNQVSRDEYVTADDYMGLGPGEDGWEDDIGADLPEDIPDEPEGAGPISISITDYGVRDNFRYEFMMPGDTVLAEIDFGQCLCGRFEYSRELTEAEKEKWARGGHLYDSNGNVIEETEDDYASFFATQDGIFAVEFPQELPDGKYTYELMLVLDDQIVTTTLDFEK